MCFYEHLGPSLCTCTSSATLMVCVLRPAFRWYSRSDIRYLDFHVRQYWSTRSVRRFNRLRIPSLLELLLLTTTSLLNGSDVNLRPYNKCAGVRGSGWSAFDDLSFMNASASMTIACNISRFT